MKKMKKFVALAAVASLAADFVIRKIYFPIMNV